MIQLDLVENSVKPFLYTARLREDSNGKRLEWQSLSPEMCSYWNLQTEKI
jgi:hypothetical protein